MACVGDVTPYERTQPILARYTSGYILGQLFGQAAGGVLGDLIGWRSVFFVLAVLFGVAAVGLVMELVTNPRTNPPQAYRHRFRAVSSPTMSCCRIPLPASSSSSG